MALVQTVAHHVRLYAINTAAVDAGLRPDMNLADARALAPGLITVPADPQGDVADLLRLTDWCGRYSPWAAADSPDGIMLDITGVPHLFGGEPAMLGQIQAAFRRMGLRVTLGTADTPSAAWAWARFGKAGILPAGSGLRQLGTLPVVALKLDSLVVQTLLSLGLRTIADLAKLPRGPLARRFGPGILDRLDSLLGHRNEPISPRVMPASWRSRVDLAEPISTRETIDLLLTQLLTALCQLLEQEQLGARQLSLHAYRVDGEVQTLSIGTARPNREPTHLFRLFRDKLDHIEPGFGIETLILEANSADILTPEQAVLESHKRNQTANFGNLIDRLRARLGHRSVYRQHPVDNHCPERAVISTQPLARWQAQAEISPDYRPVLLLQPPELAEMQSDVSAFRWRRLRRRIRQSTGPERLRGEWWRDGMDVAARDYYRVEDEQGRRYWLFRSRDGWFVHGLFL